MINRTLLLVLIVFLAIGISRITRAQETIPISGDRLSGVVLPIEPIAADIDISALRASAWTIDDTKRLHLEGDVVIAIGQYRFESDEAVMWINRLPSAGGVINQVAMYFEQVSDPRRTAGLGVEGSRLLVTASARGDVRLHVTLLRERQADDEMVRTGERRLAQHIQRLLATPPPLEQIPQADAPPVTPLPPLVPGGVTPEDLPPLPQELALPPGDVPLFDPDGAFAISAGEIEIVPGAEENVIIATGSLVVEYMEEGDSAAAIETDGPRHLTLSAQRGVVFTKPGPISELPSIAMDADFIRGIYLEGGVLATDGEYTVRGNRVYYDVERQQAIMLDGVVRTYSRELDRPVYARAEEFRQISRDQWRARQAIASTSEFFTPHLAIGAGEVTITRDPGDEPGEEAETYFESVDNTIRVGDVPIFYWPRLEGTIGDLPLRGLRVGHRDNDGAFIRTEWDLYALSGNDAPGGIDWELDLDFFTKRGVGIGTQFEYERDDVIGLLDLYLLPDDNGIDKTSAGREVDPDEDTRGLALWEHHAELNSELTLQLQGSYISDESFISAWREDDFAERREYETSAYLRNVDDHTAWTLLAKYDALDFVPNAWILASRQYQVEKLPELTYRRYGDSLFDNALTYSSEYRVSRMSLSFEEHTPDELGMRPRAFGIGRDDEIAEMLEARGLTEDIVNRFDMRHELSMPGRIGTFEITPFVVGRFTAYDSDFEEFSSDSDDTRFFGAAGVRISTTFQRVHNDVESRLFDLWRLRHLVEPSVLVWYGHSSVDQADLPIYDETVESLADGAAVRFGVVNTWQTYRGGPGRWYTVDVFKLDTALVLTDGDDDEDRQYPVPQFFEYRPEYSILVDHMQASALWQVSDTFALVGETIYDLNESRVARGSVGAHLQHTPQFATYAEYRTIDPLDLELLDVGWTYQATPKYRLTLTPQWDFRFDEFRAVRVAVTRSFPDFDFTLSVRHDEIKDETQVSATIGEADF